MLCRTRCDVAPIALTDMHPLPAFVMWNEHGLDLDIATQDHGLNPVCHGVKLHRGGWNGDFKLMDKKKKNCALGLLTSAYSSQSIYYGITSWIAIHPFKLLIQHWVTV